MDATAMLDRQERVPGETFVPGPVKAEMAYRKPAIEQYPQHNRAARRHAAKMVRRKQAKVA